MRASVWKCVNISKLFAFTASLTWLILVIRYLDVRPDYASRRYLKNFYQIQQNTKIVRMTQINSFLQE
jgi:hypothetical protein